MNQRSTNRSFDAAMRLFQTRQRLDGRGVGQNEGDGSTLGRVGGLALCAGFGLHGLTQQLAEFLRDGDGQRVGVAGVGHSAFRREATELAGLGVAGLDGDLAEVSGGSAVAGSDAVNVNLAARHGDHAGSDLCGGEGGVHGLLQAGPIPAMSNPKAVTSDESSPFGKKIMNGGRA